ncbi:MAG: hypothetical protein ACTSVY_14295 [Candidatus Helarchaeota archaeon]
MKGFNRTYLIKDIIEIEEYSENIHLKAEIVSQIEQKIIGADFNLFVLFNNENDSTIAELTFLIKSEEFRTKKNTTLVCIPHDYDAFIIVSLLEEYELPVFRYLSDIQIFQKCYTFLLQNMRRLL